MGLLSWGGAAYAEGTANIKDRGRRVRDAVAKGKWVKGKVAGEGLGKCGARPGTAGEAYKYTPSW